MSENKPKSAPINRHTIFKQFFKVTNNNDGRIRYVVNDSRERAVSRFSMGNWEIKRISLIRYFFIKMFL